MNDQRTYLHHHRPSFSATSSSSSSSSIPSLASPTSLTEPIDIPAFTMPAFDFSGSAAPMPSPSISQTQPFFLQTPPHIQPYNTPFGSPMQHYDAQQSQPQQQQQPRYNLRSHAQRQRQEAQCFSSHFAQSQQALAQNYQQQSYEQHPYPQRQSSTSSTDSEASAHLRDFSLLAEAAKRAQLACVTRDLEEMEF